MASKAGELVAGSASDSYWMNEASGGCLVDNEGDGSMLSSPSSGRLLMMRMLSSPSTLLEWLTPGGRGGLVVGLLFFFLLRPDRARGGDEPGSGGGIQESSLPLFVGMSSGDS